MLSRQALLRSARAAAPSRAFASQVRFYAAPAANETVKPPVALFGLDGTYATALYTAAAKTSSLDPTATALSKLGNLVAKDAKLVKILEAPTLSASDKSLIIAELEKTAGSNETIKNFLRTLAENNRLSLLGGVCTKFTELMSAARGEVEMTVTSATPLDNKTLNRLESAAQVNPDIIGGLVVEIGDRTIDLSVSSKIAKMNKLLTDTL
ncbi:ATP synthase subunit 5, mitochondrial [Cytospora mali]|uniref:ATP synthase subunit 5, mitochondrial n=1 Tax=Cytospora mali TaxID=578113 RepID=A0A194VES6_CYTMA|nr:ATP synthase subunit 5, mitochondrial [Valsa mali var. pyri (nom. inval.)]